MSCHNLKQYWHAGGISLKFLVRIAAKEMTKNNLQTSAEAWTAIPTKYKTVLTQELYKLAKKAGITD